MLKCRNVYEAVSGHGPLSDPRTPLIPAQLDAHFNRIRQAFEEADLTAPRVAISDTMLARAISEFTSVAPNEASIATLELRLNPQALNRITNLIPD